MNFSSIKNRITLQNILLLYLILCPFLDCASFLFRQHFNTFFSISTILRPIIPIGVIIYLFFKDKIKLKLIIGGTIYLIYAIVHIFIFKSIVTECAYGNWLRELQYVVNYTFMIMNLFLYIYVFIYRNKEFSQSTLSSVKSKIKKTILITFTIYIAIMYLAIISGTSSYTYAEDEMGQKGWFESGNSVGTLMIICLFIVIPMIEKTNERYIKIIAIIDVILSGTYLSMLLGTRTGLLGFALTGVTYMILKAIYGLLHNKKINKKIFVFGMSIFAIIMIVVIVFGSNTIKRRKLLNQREDLIYDENIGESAHVTGDLVKIVNDINEGRIQRSYMNDEMQGAIEDLYRYNNKRKISNTNMRMIQLVYHSALIARQRNIGLVLFGNGYMTHFYELIFEMEVPAFLFNFGIIGFALYFIPFLVITIYGMSEIIKKIKHAKVEDCMNIIALLFALGISALAGYTFFNSSTVTIVTAICVMIISSKEFKNNENI